MRIHGHFLIAVLASPLVVFAACSESNDAAGPVTDSGLVDSGSKADTATGTDTNVPPKDSGGDTAPKADVGGALVTINEIRGSGGDYIELFNTGTTSADLSGWTLSGDKLDAGAPNVFTFPSGTSLAAGAYLLIVGKDPDAGAGPVSDCLDAGASCFHVSWSVSNKSGADLELQSPTATVSSAIYPADAVASGLSLGRIPNGTGDFKPNAPTPGAANVAAP